MKMKIKYLLVTQIPFTTNAAGEPVVDRLWARDLIGLAESVGAVRVVAPEVPATAKFDTWGPDAMPIPIGCGVTFVGFPEIRSRLDVAPDPLGAAPRSQAGRPGALVQSVCALHRAALRA